MPCLPSNFPWFSAYLFYVVVRFSLCFDFLVIFKKFFFLNFGSNFTEKLQSWNKMFMCSLHPAFLDVNILHNLSTRLKTRKWPLGRYSVTYVQTLSGWHQLFHLKSCSVPGFSPEKHITLSHQDSLVFSDLWLLLILVLHSVTFLAKDYVSVALSTVSQFTFVWRFMISLLELQIWGEHKNKRPAHHCKRSVSAQDPRD